MWLDILELPDTLVEECPGCGELVAYCPDTCLVMECECGYKG